MTQDAGGTQRIEPGPSDNPAEALSAVVDNVRALARAELRLAAAEAKIWLMRMGLGLVLLWLSLLLIQVLAVALALSPVLLVSQPWTAVALMLVVALTLCVGVSIFAVRELRRLKEVGHEQNVRQLERH